MCRGLHAEVVVMMNPMDGKVLSVLYGMIITSQQSFSSRVKNSHGLIFARVNDQLLIHRV